MAAVQSGKAKDIWDAHKRKLTEHWSVDFGRLFEFAGGGKTEVAQAKLYGSRPPPNDSLWLAAERKGFQVTVFDRNLFGKEKKVDGQIITDMMEDSFTHMDPTKDEITLVSGDADYVPTIQNLMNRGFRFYVVFWSNAAVELRETCTQFVPIDQYLDHLRLR